MPTFIHAFLILCDVLIVATYIATGLYAAGPAGAFIGALLAGLALFVTRTIGIRG